MSYPHFTKYDSAGNTFALFEGEIPDNVSEIAKAFCDYDHGVGVDGIMFVDKSGERTFILSIYNPDGSRAEMCGNGLRAALFHMCHKHGQDEWDVQTDAGGYGGKMTDRGVKILAPIPKLQDIDLDKVKLKGKAQFYDAGVPHLVIPSQNLTSLPVEKLSAKLRYDRLFPEGANVNWIQARNDFLYIRTYERGVERETLACGTGVLSSAWFAKQFLKMEFPLHVEARGGSLFVDQENDKQLSLVGPCRAVFKGEYLL